MPGRLEEQDLWTSREKGFTAIRRRPGILIADDMALVLTMLKFELEPRGFFVWLAVDGDDALDLYRRNRTEIDLVVLDAQLPGLDGLRALDAMRRLNPIVLACFMRGTSGNYTEAELQARGAACVFNKPFLAAEVAHRLLKLFESSDSLNAGRLIPTELTQ